MKIIPLISPFSGIIIDINKNKIKIKINQTNLNIYSPIDGIINNIKDKSLSFSNEYLEKPIIISLLEESKFILNKSNNDKVYQGEKIGELQFGNNIYIQIEFDNMFSYNVVNIDSKLEGGKTIICYIFNISNKTKIPIISDLINKLSKEQITNVINNGGINIDLKQLIVITTSHEKCVSYVQRDCDRNSRRLADQLLNTLSPDNTKEVVLFSGNINRIYDPVIGYGIDLNRREGYNTDFRKMVRTKVLDHIRKLINLRTYTNYNNIIYILDCHSFPSSDSFDNIRTKNPDITILFDDCYQLILVEELTDIFRENGLAYTKLIGVNNDIIDEFINLNNNLELKTLKIKIVPILLEINEQIEEYKISLIGKSFYQWINNVNNYLH